MIVFKQTNFTHWPSKPVVGIFQTKYDVPKRINPVQIPTPMLV
jgi:hypothetical protein